MRKNRSSQCHSPYTTLNVSAQLYFAYEIHVPRGIFIAGSIEHIKETHAADIERVKVEAAEQAIGDVFEVQYSFNDWLSRLGFDALKVSGVVNLLDALDVRVHFLHPRGCVPKCENERSNQLMLVFAASLFLRK